MNTVPAGCGWNWVRTGFALFRKNPAMWAFLVFSYIILMQLLGMIPVLGWFAATVLIPAFTASFMIVSRELDQGRRIGFALLFSGFRSNLPALLGQGGLYLASALAILALSALVDGGLLLQFMVLGQKPPAAAFEDGSLAAAAALAGTLYLPVLAAFWFAPALSAWRDLPALQALFYSLFAALHNWRAFLAYGLALLLLGLICSFALLLLATLIRGLLGNKSQDALMLVVLPVMLTYVPTLFASFYASYRDVFPPPDAAIEASPDPG
ncbi:MAG: BPSS1780 family membrane protein [Pseudomonadota bacterium]